MAAFFDQEQHKLFSRNTKITLKRLLSM